jgi:alanyl-tRNA synthetase
LHPEAAQWHKAGVKTERLEQQDPHLVHFDARVLSHGTMPGGDAASVVLDQSAFYPESGGQMADRGTLGGAAVLDVQIEAAIVHHRIDGPLPAIGARVEGAIDRDRRRTHMALHSAQHALSRALADLAGADTKSSRLGETACTVDVDVPGLADAKLSEAEDAVNRLVDDDRAVRAWLPTDEELRALPLRRAPKQSEGIRIVDLGGFDVSPCGGTHVTRTAQIGLFRIEGSERYKGGTRVTFSAGIRARSAAQREWVTLGRAASRLAVPRADVEAGIERLERRLREEQERGGRLRAELASELARRAEPDARGRVYVDVAEAGVELAKQLATTLARGEGLTVVVRASVEGAGHLIVMRGPGSSADCGGLLRRLAAAAGGKGGGRPEHAEGRLPAGFDVRSALDLDLD